MNSLSDASFDAPYKFTGFTALSVDKAKTFETFVSKTALITFSAPLTFVLMHSKGLYSAAGTCYNAAA